LPYLARAAKADDLEVARRAQRLQAEIEAAIAGKRKKLFTKGSLPAVNPTLAYVPKAETRNGFPIHIVNMKMATKEQAAVADFKQLLGPEWDKIRVAVHGKHVVMFLGSDLLLLEDALANLKGNKPGLAAWKEQAPFNKQRHPAPRFEVHVPLERYQALVTGARVRQPNKPGRSLSSWALALQTDHVQVDFRISSADLKAMARAERQ
jgi:hypothetical protein